MTMAKQSTPQRTASKTAMPLSSVLGTGIPNQVAPGAGTPVNRVNLRNTTGDTVGGKPQRIATTSKGGGGGNW
jgi:hypothetical protein